MPFCSHSHMATSNYIASWGNLEECCRCMHRTYLQPFQKANVTTKSAIRCYICFHGVVCIYVWTSPWLGGCTQLCRYVAVVSAEWCIQNSFHNDLFFQTFLNNTFVFRMCTLSVLCYLFIYHILAALLLYVRTCTTIQWLVWYIPCFSLVMFEHYSVGPTASLQYKPTRCLAA